MFMDHTIEIAQPDRIITQDELEQIVLSARRSISSSDHPDDRDAVRDVLCTATGAAHLLEICGGDPAEFYDIVLSLPVRELFTHGCEEDLLYAHALLRRKILNIRQGQYPAGELPAYDFPGTDGISALQALVIADMGTLVLTQKTDELRTLYDNMTRTGGRKRIREQIRRIQDDI